MDIYRELRGCNNNKEEYLTIVVELPNETVVELLRKSIFLEWGVLKRRVLITAMAGNGGKRTKVQIPIYISNHPGLGEILYDLDNREASTPRENPSYG